MQFSQLGCSLRTAASFGQARHRQARTRRGQGPDGHLYVLTDEGNSRILRVVPDKP